MSGFSTFEAFVLVEGTDYELTADLVWAVGQKQSPWLLTVAENEPFDLSVPWWARWLQSPHDRQLLPAAAVHDELLRRGFDKPFAAAEFRRAARARGIGPRRAWALFFAVLIWTSVR